MRLHSLSTLRFALLLWFVGGSAFALQTHHGRGLTTVHRAIHAVARDVIMDEASRAVAGREGQGKVDLGSPSGAESGFDIPGVVRFAFELAVGLYLTLGGMRWWRITTGLAIGLVLAFCGQSSSLHPSYSNQRDWGSVCSLGDDHQRHKCEGCNRYHPYVHHFGVFRAWVSWGSFQVLSYSRTRCFEYHRWHVSRDASCSSARGAPLETNSSELDHHRPIHGGWVRSDSV